MKKLILLTIFLSLTIWSCATKKKTTTDKETIVKVDTIKIEKIVEKEVIKTEKVVDTFVVQVPCDEKGNLKDFDRKIKTSGGLVRVWSKKGNIYAEMVLEATQNSTLNQSEKESKSKTFLKNRRVTYEKIITKYKERWWLWVWFIGTCLFIVWKIYNFIRPKVI